MPVDLLTPRKVAVAAGSLVAFGAAVALAGTLSIGVGGSTEIVSETAAGELQVTEVSASGRGMFDCLTSNNGNDVTFRPIAKKTNGKIAEAAQCTFVVRVKNTGTATVSGIHLQLDRSQPALKGWSVLELSGDNITIPAGGNSAIAIAFEPAMDVSGQGSSVGAVTANDGV